MISFFARHPTAANLLMLVIVSAGILSIPLLRRETFPDYSPVEVEVRVAYPGATAEEVEEAICQRVEDAVDGVRFVREVRSDARHGLGIVTVEMEPGGDYQAFKEEIDTAVAAIDTFPREAEHPVITRLHTTDLVLAILVTGPMPPSDLKDYCEDLKRRLQQVPGISLVEIEGFSERQLRIELSDETLRRYGLNAAEVAEIIRRQSVNLPAGTVETRDSHVTVRFVEERRTPPELEELIIAAGPGGAEVRLKDLATISDTFKLDEEQIQFRGRRAGLLNVRMTKIQDVIQLASSVREFLDAEQQQYPQLQFEIAQNNSTLVEDRLKLLAKNTWEGLLLVFLTMWLFFSLRLSFWVVMSLPISFLGAFFLMPYLGLSINMMTMMGLLLALGILLDDGIVIGENIATHRARGKSALQAAIDGVNEVKAGVFSSFITTACVLGPLAFLEGDIGSVLEVIPLMLILVLVVSLVEAFLILPAHLGHSLHHYSPEQATGFRRWFDKIVEWVREQLLGKTVDVLLRWRYLWIGTVTGLFIVSLAVIAGGVVKFQAFPDLDGDVIEARLVLAPGTPLSRTEEVVAQVSDGLHRVNEQFAPLQPGGQNLVETVYVRFNRNPDAFENGPHIAAVTANLLTAERRNARLDDVLRAWRDEVGQAADVVSLAYTEPGFGPQGRSIEIRIQGHDLSELKEAAGAVRQWFSSFRGVFNLSDDLRPGQRELRLRLREGAFGLGLDAENMSRQLRSAFQGVTAHEIQVGTESYEIDVRYRKGDRDSLADFDYFFFTLPNGERVPLGAVAEVETYRGWSRIARVNGLRTVTVRGDVDAALANTANLMADLNRSLLPELSAQFPGIQLSIEGEPKEGATTRNAILRGMLIGLLGVFILLSFQFRSYLEPLIVMSAIPLALIGVVAGHLVMGINLSMPSLLGFVSLTGIVVNDSILLILYFKMRREQGAEIIEAAAQASRNRFRAIIITSTTTIAGLLPLLTERSLQAQVLIPMATSIAFGLFSSTILILLVIPCLYAILGDWRLVASVRTQELPGTNSSPTEANV
jgi:hydrophobic/amphiphilic exporter-1 (mainly G- bacteria), HAE1 family